MRLRFYICPTDGCGNYYGSSGMPDLTASESFGGELHERTQARDRCPDCGATRVLREMLLPDLHQPVEAT